LCTTAPWVPLPLPLGPKIKMFTLRLLSKIIKVEVL
jgi:hypothetical protein